jgi:hypothetical protein
VQKGTFYEIARIVAAVDGDPARSHPYLGGALTLPSHCDLERVLARFNRVLLSYAGTRGMHDFKEAE